MGFDLHPRKQSASGIHYNIWSWHPLWRYVLEVCGDIITEEDFQSGGFNDGYFINSVKSRDIAKRLKEKYIDITGIKMFIDNFYKPSGEIKLSDFRKDIAKLYRFCEKSGGFRIY